MSAKIDTSDFDLALKGLSRVSRSLQKDLVRNLHEAGPRIVADMKSGAHSRIQRRAAKTVHSSNDSKGVVFHGGGGEVLFAGGEFGGRKSKKVAYSTRSRAGRAYAVRRRTTMQFFPHLGHEGYFFWPAIRDWLPKLYKLQQETVEKAVSGK